MPKEILSRYLKMQETTDKQKLQLILQIAPLLKGVKLSCIFVIQAVYLNMILNELKDTPISLRVLCKSEGRYTIMLYRKDCLKTYLDQQHIRTFLKQYGYQTYQENLETQFNNWMSLLEKRVSYFHQKEGTFPHEIGVFLGYPMQDVLGFIENAGENYILNGYWKVYSDAKAAKARFQSYDAAKIETVNEIYAGKSLREIAKS